MIRHSSSLIFSLLFHALLFVGLFFIYISIPNYVHKEKKIPIKLCNVIIEKKIPIQKVEKKTLHKDITPIKKVKKKKTLKKKNHKKKIIRHKKVVHKKIISKKPIKQEEKTQSKPIEKEKPQINQAKYETKREKSKKTVKIPIVQKSIKEKFIDNNMQKIVKLLKENLYYPRSARKRGITGEVTVSFNINTNGKVDSIKIEKSHSNILSRAAKKTIQNLSGKFPKPKEKLLIHLPIDYKLF